MRIKNLIKGDLTFQVKYGFYFVYTFLTIFYICLIYAFPETWRTKAGTILIYSDPAAMGLFFMGAIVLLEKSQRVLNSIAVSPVKATDYINSKIISLGVIGTLVSIIIAVASGSKNIASVIVGVFLGSSIFTLFGLIVAAKVNSLNQFMIATVPFELFCFAPPILYLLGYQKNFMLLHPGCIIIRLIYGNLNDLLVLLPILFIWITLIYYITFRVVKKMFQSVGGVKL